MAGADAATKHILQSLFANLVIAVSKGVGAALTGSGSMVAETIHSLADCGNQLLLLLGVSQAQRRPTPTHPLGHGPALYFWSFIVSLLLFSGGGLFSIYEGIHKLDSTATIDNPMVAIAILVLSLALEGWVTAGNVVELNRRRGAMPFFQFLRATKDSDLVVVFAENAAAVLGLAFALAALGLAWLTGDPVWDAVGSLCIGAVLVAVAVLLAIEIASLLIGEAADAAIVQAVFAAAAHDVRILSVFDVIAVQRGPGEVLVAAKLHVASDVTAEAMYDLVNAFEDRVRAASAEVKWLFVEPDRPGRDAGEM